MNIAAFGERAARALAWSWHTWLLIGAAVFIAADVALHVFGRSNTPEAQNFVVPAPQDVHVTLSPAQRAAVGIAVEAVTLKPHAEMFNAPGKVQVDEYATSNVSSRLRATVISRNARLGDRTRRGVALVVLYSSDMAEAQTAFVLASKNFARMNNLKAYISGQQFDEAEVKRDEARGRLETYGLAPAEIGQLASSGLTKHPAGQFVLTAPQDGVVTADPFREGEVIEPGKTLFEISNLASVWVEAQVSPAIFPRIVGNRARVTIGGNSFEGKIVQSLEVLNEATRTVGVRLQVANPAGALRPGEFVNVELFSQAEPEIFVPTEAVLRDPDGNWMVYVENATGAFEPVHVEPLHTAGNETAISGISEGANVVTKGAFFVKSEAEKSGFGGDD